MISASVVIKVQFYDLDPMGIVWHGNYPRFLEQARSELFEKISFGYRAMTWKEITAMSLGVLDPWQADRADRRTDLQ